MVLLGLLKVVAEVGKMLLFNPGSLKSPRSKLVPSYLILDITDEKIDFTFKEAETNITIEDIYYIGSSVGRTKLM